MKLRARDKVGEAEFFLELAKSHKDNLKKFRWCLSALVAALRSVGWVLQKDLRSKHGETFETWWTDESVGLSKLPLARALIDLRNVTQKQGNRLPRLQLDFEDPDHPGDRMMVQYDLSSEEMAQINFWTGGGFATVEPSEVEKMDELAVAASVLNRGLPAMSAMMQRFLVNVKPVARIVIDDADTTLSIDDFLGQVEDHLNNLRDLVARAEARFPPSHDFPL